jgi:hypothetical protein
MDKRSREERGVSDFSKFNAPLNMKNESNYSALGSATKK